MFASGANFAIQGGILKSRVEIINSTFIDNSCYEKNGSSLQSL
jgi:hypothetical protein